MADIEDKIISCEDLAEIRKKHKKIAFCSGCFDVLHSGHAVFFRQCKSFADTLVVSVGSDSVLKILKGQGRPVNPEKNRMYLLAAFQDVDYVILGEEEIRPGKINFYNTIKNLKPDIFVLNDDDSAVKEKKALCENLGIELKLVPRVVLPFLKKISTTEIIKKIKNAEK